jgi:hypothetical protein
MHCADTATNMAIEDGALSLTGKKTLLQPFTEDDVSTDYLSWLADPWVMRFSNQRFRLHTRDSAMTYLTSFAGSLQSAWLKHNGWSVRSPLIARNPTRQLTWVC